MSILRLPRDRLRLRPIRVGLTPPLAPSNLAATVLSGQSVKLDWTDNSTNETGFSIEQDGVEVSTPAADATTANITGLTVNQAYSFRMRALNGAGYSSYTTPNVSATPKYQYGYPAFTAAGTEPNVVAQWKLNESASPLIDTVSGISLAEIGSPTYSVTAAGAFSALSPGITIGSGTTGFISSAPVASLAPGLLSFTIEFWYKGTSTGTRGIFDTSNDGGSATGGIEVYWTGTATLHVDAYENAGSSILTSIDLSGTNINDGNLHKIRASFNRATNATFYLDGVSQGISLISGGSSKVIGAGANVTLGCIGTGVIGLNGTLFEFRLSHNKNNNSGGPNGG